MSNEIWRKVSDWPYEVSDAGRVRNAVTLKPLKLVAHKSGYLNVQIWNHGRHKTCLAHRLVALAFIGEPPSILHEVAHGDGDRHNNAAANLRWVLHKENMRDRDRHGATACGLRNGKLKHSDAVVRKARQMRADGHSGGVIAKALNISKHTIYGYICGNRRGLNHPSD